MLKSLGSPALLMRFGSRVYVCMRKKCMQHELLERVRPIILGGYACWCDKPDMTD